MWLRSGHSYLQWNRKTWNDIQLLKMLMIMNDFCWRIRLISAELRVLALFNISGIELQQDKKLLNSSQFRGRINECPGGMAQLHRGIRSTENMEIEADGEKNKKKKKGWHPRFDQLDLSSCSGCLQMDQRINGTCSSCLAIIYSLHLAIEIQVHCSIAVGSCQIPVKYPVCTLAAKVAKDFGQCKFDFFIPYFANTTLFPLWVHWLLSGKFQNWQMKQNRLWNFSQ